MSALVAAAKAEGQLNVIALPPDWANYGAIISGFTAKYGITVNSICPGMIRTDVNRSVWRAWNERQPEVEKLDYEAWGSSKVKQVAPMGRWQEPTEIG